MASPVTDLTTALDALDGVERIGHGKVRELYTVGDELLLVATDRISAYDAVLGSEIPDKGRVLTGLTDFWLDHLSDVVANHRITCRVDEFPPTLAPVRELLRGRAMLCRHAEVVPVECVARGYLSGSGWQEYRETGAVCGVALPDGLDESSRLPEPIFTPATKATSGHDENVPFGAVADLVGAGLATELRDVTLTLYRRAAEHAAQRGIILADTKFELGFVDGALTLVDEVCTPDSSRFWPAERYEPGGPQPSFDKQYVRDWLTRSGWDRNPPAPALPDDVVAATRERYVAAYELLTGRPFADWNP
jgi:phosphoribosylaminoimidazole-succinocarboxamide synthase